MCRRARFKNKNAGVSLVELMIAVSLFGILVLFAARLFEINKYWVDVFERDNDLVMAKVEILQMVDCNSSVSRNDNTRAAGGPIPECAFTPPNCPTNNYLPLRSKNRSSNGGFVVKRWSAPAVTKSDTSVYGKNLDIRASCVCCPYCAGGKGIQVEYKKLNAEPWQKYKPMFGGIPLGCVVPAVP